MSLYNGPPRPGARGGRDQFNWENVRTDKDREFYLGHSVKALQGRWQKNKDVYWYTRDKGTEDTSLQDELRAVKAREEAAMMEALGLKPKSDLPPPPPTLNSNELAQLLKRRTSDGDQALGAPALGAPGLEGGDAIHGLGFTAQKAMGVAARSDSLTMELGATMAGEGMPGPSGAGADPQKELRQAGGAGAALPGPPGAPTLYGSAALMAMVRAGVKLSSAQRKLLSDTERKEVRKLRKELKKVKKHKKHKKHKKKRLRSTSSSSGSDGSDSSDSEGEKKKQDNFGSHTARAEVAGGRREPTDRMRGDCRGVDGGREADRRAGQRGLADGFSRREEHRGQDRSDAWDGKWHAREADDGRRRGREEHHGGRDDHETADGRRREYSRHNERQQGQDGRQRRGRDDEEQLFDWDDRRTDRIHNGRDHKDSRSRPGYRDAERSRGDDAGHWDGGRHKGGDERYSGDERGPGDHGGDGRRSAAHGQHSWHGGRAGRSRRDTPSRSPVGSRSRSRSRSPARRRGRHDTP